MKLFLKNLLFTLIVPGSVAVYFPLLIAHGMPIYPSLFTEIIGVAILLSGAAIYLWTVFDFAVSGRGTPLPLDAPKKLVVRGLYRFVRNPMYLGVLAVILGWAVLYLDAWLLLYALVVGLLVHLFVVFYEEPKLEHLFGSQYDAYRRKAGRWLPVISRREK